MQECHCEPALQPALQGNTMKKILRPFYAIIVLGLATIVYAASVNCPIDSMSMYFTGNTRTEMGKLLYEYKCPNSHTAWVVQ